MLRTMQGLNADLTAMGETFASLVKASKVPIESHSKDIATVPRDMLDVFVENIITRGARALEKVNKLKKTCVLECASTVGERLKKTQKELDKYTAHVDSLVTRASGGPVQEMQDLLSKLEQHYYQSKALSTTETDVPEMDERMEELCQQAFHSHLAPM